MIKEFINVTGWGGPIKTTPPKSNIHKAKLSLKSVMQHRRKIWSFKEWMEIDDETSYGSRKMFFQVQAS